MDASPIERLRIEREKSITLLKENGYWSVTSLDLLEELKWSSLMALSDDEQAEALPRALAEYALMAMESVPAAEAGPSVAEVLADFALMAMESLPVAEAGPSVTEALADSAEHALGDLPVGEVSCRSVNPGGRTETSN